MPAGERRAEDHDVTRLSRTRCQGNNLLTPSRCDRLEERLLAGGLRRSRQGRSLSWDTVRQVLLRCEVMADCFFSRLAAVSRLQY